MTETKIICTFAARQIAREVGIKKEKSGFKNLENKVCEIEKVFYLCSPKTRERKSETGIAKNVKAESESQQQNIDSKKPKGEKAYRMSATDIPNKFLKEIENEIMQCNAEEQLY